MTWGVEKSQKQPPSAYTTPAPGYVPVTSASKYSHHPKKSVLAVACLILISGVSSIGLGIGQSSIAHHYRGLGIHCGIFFIITSILGIVSVYKRTRGRLIATGILALLAALTALYMGCEVSRSYWKARSMAHRQRIDDGGIPIPSPTKDALREMLQGGKLREKMRDRVRRGGDRHDKKKKGDDDDSWEKRWRKKKDHDDDDWDRDDKKRWKKYDNDKWWRKELNGCMLTVSAILFFFALLTFPCAVALTVFALRTVTSPRTGPPPDIPPTLTPVVAFPFSKDPNQLDSYNGNDDYI